MTSGSHMRGLAVVVLSLTLGGCCFGDIGCDYYALTTERVEASCKAHGGVRSVDWVYKTAVCNDGKLQAFVVDYEKKPPVDPR